MRDFKHFKISIENKILVIRFKGYCDINKEVAKEINHDINSFLDLYNIEKIPFLLFPTGKVKISLKAKNYLGASEAYDRATKMAYVNPNMFFNFIFDVYKLMNHESKMELFDSEEDALAWIKIEELQSSNQINIQ